MPAMIWDEKTQAFKEAENPKVWSESTQAFVDTDAKMWNGNAWVDAWTAGIPGVDAVTVGKDYNLGSGAHTNKNGVIKVRCLSKSGNNAVMQTYGVTAAAWPGAGDLTNSYKSYFGSLAPAISGVKLPTGSSTSNISPSGSHEVLKSTARNYSSFGITYNSAWLGTPYGSGYAYCVNSDGGVYNGNTSVSYVSAPYFTLDLTKVVVDPKAPTVLLAK